MAVVLNRDMGPVMCVPSLGELLAAALCALREPRSPPPVAYIGHQAGLPDARLQLALLCMAAAEGGMSLVVAVFLQCVNHALQRQRPHAPQPWEEYGQRWQRVENLAPTHPVGQADM